MDELTKKILEEADNLDAYIMDEVETIFLPNEVLQNIDYYAHLENKTILNQVSVAMA